MTGKLPWALVGRLVFSLALARAAPVGAVDSVDDTLSAVQNWPLERVVLLDGKSYQGLVSGEGLAEIEFTEVRRPAGKPMNLVVRAIDRRSIVSWERLPAADHATLSGRIERFRNRARIEARRIEDLWLTAIRRDGTLYWQYAGEWFFLESTAEEAMTRRSIARIEQVFAAYRQILPPQATPRRRLRILLLGGSDRYREYLGGLGLDIGNPAFFASDFNLVVAGSDMNRFGAQLAKVRRQHQLLLQDYDRRLADLPVRLKDLSEQLRRSGTPADERTKIAQAEQKKWKDELAELHARIKVADRRNAGRFQEITGQMFGRLNHEAFHAYLENYVYPQHAYDVPRWLNEGLAQTFENGLLEADTLRVDAPNPRALLQLQSDLSGPRPLALGEVLAADANLFLSGHRGDTAASARLYLYSWGLTYYLTFVQPVLGTKALDEYVSADAADQPDSQRFERLVGMPLESFDARWRKAMLELKP